MPSGIESFRIMKGKTTGHLACFIAYAIFGINIIVCKDLTSSQLISPIALFCLRSIGAGILFWLASCFIPQEKVEKKDYGKILSASLLGFFLTQMTFLMAIPDITPMDCSIVSSLSPIYTMFIAAYALKEPITLRKVGGVTISLLGVLYLIMNSVTGAGSSVQTSWEGIILMILNSLCFSLYLGLFKPVIVKYSVITFMKWIFPVCYRLLFSDSLQGTDDLRLQPTLKHLPVRIGLSHCLFHVHHLLPDSCRTETYPPYIGQHVFLCTAHHCHCHQHLHRNGYAELAKDTGCCHGVRWCCNGKL